MLYNALRMHKQRDPSVRSEEWQIWDYRQIPLQDLFELLSAYTIHLDKESYIAYAELCDSPDELTESLLADAEVTDATYDQIFLVLFELWRRLVPEKRCLTIFCDELDTQMYLYDTDLFDSPEHLEDAIGNLKQILEDHADEGADSKVLFTEISANCAYDIEGFLYDFINERIEHGNLGYASELIDDFKDYVVDSKWFQLLQAKCIAAHNPSEADDEIHSLVKKTLSEKDLDFHLEVLPFLVQEGNRRYFLEVARNAISNLRHEEDFVDLLCLCSDYYQCLDNEKKETDINQLITNRTDIPFEAPFDPEDKDIKEIRRILRAK